MQPQCILQIIIAMGQRILTLYHYYRNGHGGAGMAGPKVLFEKRVGIGRTAAVSRDVAWAMSDDVRRRIVQLLYKRSMTTAEIAEAVAQDGIEKARTTIRHHMSILEKAGIIDVCRIVQVRGMMEKHYTASTRMIGRDAEEGFDEAYSSEISAAARRMGKIIAQLAPRAARRSQEDGADPEYEEFVLTEIVNRAMTRVFEARGAGAAGAAR